MNVKSKILILFSIHNIIFMIYYHFRFSAVTASVPSVWPNFFHPTSLDKLVTYTRKDLYEPALSSPIILQL